MKVFLTGAAGMLAAEVTPQLKNNGFEVTGVDVNPRLSEIENLDITDKDAVFNIVQRLKPGYIFHLAAETDVDRCEREPDLAFKVNTIGTENMALACQRKTASL